MKRRETDTKASENLHLSAERLQMSLYKVEWGTIEILKLPPPELRLNWNSKMMNIDDNDSDEDSDD